MRPKVVGELNRLLAEVEPRPQEVRRLGRTRWGVSRGLGGCRSSWEGAATGASAALQQKVAW